MEYIFVANPAAGKNKDALSLIPKIQKVCQKHRINPVVHISQSGEEIERYINSLSDAGSYRIYAIGGDGTLNNVVNGIKEGIKARVGVIPMGTGNDFVRNFSADGVDFFDIEAQIISPSQKVDCIKAGDRLCVNLCNIGFDANVAVDMPKFKRLPGVTNNMAYTMSIVYNLVHKLGRPLKVYADDSLFFEGSALMCAVGNGIACGGGFFVTPKACPDDGLIDLSVTQPPFSRIRLPDFLSGFTRGTQLEKKSLAKYIHYSKCKKVRIESLVPINMVNDGERIFVKEMEFEILPDALEFIVPKKRVKHR